jgi:hypothetical protein
MTLVDHVAELETLADLCEALADDVDAGRCMPGELSAAITHLRAELDRHGEVKLRALRAQSHMAAAIAEQQIEEHVRAYLEERRGHVHATGATGELREVLGVLRVRLDAEAEQFAPRAVRAR